MANQLNLNTELQDKPLPSYSDASKFTVLITPIPDTHLQLEYLNEQLIRIEFVNSANLFKTYETQTPKQISQQFSCFFSGKNHTFQLPYLLIGTSFQKKVWQALTRIPVGTQQTYGSLAKQLNTSPRAVGNACRKNPLPLLFPCHRIVGQNSMGGFMGQTKGHALTIKQWLLQHEAKHFR